MAKALPVTEGHKALPSRSPVLRQGRTARSARRPLGMKLWARRIVGVALGDPIPAWRAGTRKISPQLDQLIGMRIPERLDQNGS